MVIVFEIHLHPKSWEGLILKGSDGEMAEKQLDSAPLTGSYSLTGHTNEMWEKIYLQQQLSDFGLLYPYLL